MKLDAQSARMGELEALGEDLEKQLKQSVLRVCISESKYLLLYDEN